MKHVGWNILWGVLPLRLRCKQDPSAAELRASRHDVSTGRGLGWGETGELLVLDADLCGL